MRSDKRIYRILVDFLLVCLFFQSCKSKVDESPTYSEMEMEILQLINQYRIIQGFEQLEMSRFLYDESTQHTIYMIEKGVNSHDNSNERFKRIQSELGSNIFSENVASGQKTAHEVVTDWLSSDEHRKNIEGDYKLTGISAKRNREGKYYFMQIFTP